MNAMATLSKKFQISVPKAVRDELHWEAGQQFAFLPKGPGVLLIPVLTLAQLQGLAKGANPTGYRDHTDRY